MKAKKRLVALGLAASLTGGVLALTTTSASARLNDGVRRAGMDCDFNDGDWTIHIEDQEVWYSCEYSHAGLEITAVYDDQGDVEVVIWDD